MSSESERFKKAYEILIEMITDRGYIIDTIYHIDDNEDENKTEKPYAIKAHNLSNEGLLCFITNDDKLNIQGIKDKISILNKENATRCIIVYKSSITSSAKKSLDTVNYRFELFALHELQFNVTKHRLVPRHEHVTHSEKEELNKNYKGKLPILLQTDAICRYYAFEKGEYIRITRKNGTIAYRVVK
jgi:DNA-directed RNA polymerase I, II, and III subunit RPABC1